MLCIFRNAPINLENFNSSFFAPRHKCKSGVLSSTKRYRLSLKKYISSMWIFRPPTINCRREEMSCFLIYVSAFDDMVDISVSILFCFSQSVQCLFWHIWENVVKRESIFLAHSFHVFELNLDFENLDASYFYPAKAIFRVTSRVRVVWLHRASYRAVLRGTFSVNVRSLPFYTAI